MLARCRWAMVSWVERRAWRSFQRSRTVPSISSGIASSWRWRVFQYVIVDTLHLQDPADDGLIGYVAAQVQTLDAHPAGLSDQVGALHFPQAALVAHQRVDLTHD